MLIICVTYTVSVSNFLSCFLHLKTARHLFYHGGCGSEGEYLCLLVPVVAEQSESGGPGVEVDHHLHQADVDQGHQHAHSQGQGALNSARLKDGNINSDV